MPRRRVAGKRAVIKDPVYNDTLVAKFINVMMFSGKKNVGEQILYETFDQIQKKTKQDPLMIFKKAIENVKPSIEVRSRRVGGATYQVPVEVRSDRRISLAFRWIIRNARARSEKSMVQKLSAELIDAFNNRGNSIKKREDTHKMAEANKAFAHYRW
ncbi:MAG: 30S ribosomal protein S7 [Deltaproteobacteria bacterium]|nr:30S ribosomal protein S7 [Deltaproteobacteria bacterium]